MKQDILYKIETFFNNTKQKLMKQDILYKIDTFFVVVKFI